MKRSQNQRDDERGGGEDGNRTMNGSSTQPAEKCRPGGGCGRLGERCCIGESGGTSGHDSYLAARIALTPTVVAGRRGGRRGRLRSQGGSGKRGVPGVVIRDGDDGTGRGDDGAVGDVGREMNGVAEASAYGEDDKLGVLGFSVVDDGVGDLAIVGEGTDGLAVGEASILDEIVERLLHDAAGSV